MYLRKMKNKKTNRIYLSAVQGYRTAEGKSRTKTIKSFGYVDEFEKDYINPIEYFEGVVRKMNDDAQNNDESINIKLNESLVIGSSNRKNFGYAVLSHIYHQLELDDFIKNRQRSKNFQFDGNSILRLLLFGRILTPGSKKSTYERKEEYFEKFDFELHDVYRFLSFLITKKDDMQIWLNKRIKQHYQRDTSLVYYDVTNFYFEIDEQDELRKKGVSKEHRPDPIIQMGLFMDNMGIPISYGLFPGNTVDSETFRPMFGEIKRKFNLGKVIVVADRGMTTGDNIWYTQSGKDGYVLSYSILKSDATFKKYVLDEEDYVTNENGFKIKSRLIPRTINVTMTSGKKRKKTVDEKQVVFYCPKYAEKARRDRQPAIEKAMDLLNNPSRYTKSSIKGAAQYIKNIAFDKDTGVILEKEDYLLEFNEDLLREQEKYDGYYAIVTSEYKEDAKRIVEMYRGLWKIEETFKITKSDLETRPVFHSKQERIEAHFLTCFLALIIVRILEYRLNGKWSVTKLIEALQKSKCSFLQENYYHFNYYDEVLDDIGKEFNIDFSKKFMTQKEIKNVIAASKK